MMEDIKKVHAGPATALAEDKIPRDKKGAPDLAYYTEPLQRYIDLYNSFLSTDRKRLTPQQQRLAWSQRVHGEWGLLAKGQEALPFLLTLIRHPNPDAREDSSFLLGKLRLRDDTAGQLLDCLQNEKDLVVLSAIMESLGTLRYRPAIPALASFIRDKETDIDTRWNAIDSLAELWVKSFPNPTKYRRPRRGSVRIRTSRTNRINLAQQSSAVPPITQSQA